jgi:RNA polymerase sigma-70 factor (ECF subfamily)
MTDGLANQISVHVPRMFRLALRMLADADGAHDVVQDACLKALAGLGRFTGQSTMSTWLHRITVNCATDKLRAGARRVATLELLQSRANESAAGSPAEGAETRELTGLAWRLLDQLPEDCRSAFVLTQLDGYSYDEAGEIENQPRGTIASRVFRAKKILLEQMNAHIDERAKL